jgi:outer membrane lipoprotein-sorting protein
MHVWVKGDKSRTDWSLYEPPPGKNEKIRFIDDGEYKWLYDVDEHAATKYLSGAAVHQVEEQVLWFTTYYYGAASEEAILSEMRLACDRNRSCSSVAITGHEDIEGQPTTQYTYIADDGATIIYWISAAGHLVRLESEEASGRSISMEYRNVLLSPSISDDVFEFDKMAPGAVVVDMTASDGTDTGAG